MRLHYPEITRLFYRGRMPLSKEHSELPQWRQKENKEIRQGVRIPPPPSPLSLHHSSILSHNQMDFSIPPRSIVYFDLILRVLNETVVDSDLEIRTDYETRIYPIHYQVSPSSSFLSSQYLFNKGLSWSSLTYSNFSQIRFNSSRESCISNSTGANSSIKVKCRTYNIFRCLIRSRRIW